MPTTLTSLVANPLSTKDQIQSAKKFALNYHHTKFILISHDGNCPKCGTDDEQEGFIPGLDSIYCPDCQKSYPTEAGCEYGWAWDYDDLGKIKEDERERKKKKP